ncbi:MAG: Asp-tRNA(Asn)/Glu-tRNA(Gln) amidotransferase GatCAB subunit C [Thaumarchaeota archaeon]|nr:Asp-tRNA(Asn)/Glu-tRNA(Gln) amidotransferase GatCAB subunit C [Nitrososphaerota archaeon]|tara:strand:+ start:4185 stop:4460 length:276 start_codon:yes stop_codon:yes gene_type:complete
MSDKKIIDAKKYSELSKIELSDQEMNILNEQFPDILEYFDLLSQVDTSENIDDERISNIFREDTIDDSIADSILDVVPEKKDRFVKGPRMM